MKRCFSSSIESNGCHPSKKRKLNVSNTTSTKRRNYDTRVINLSNIECKQSDYFVEIKEDGLDLQYYPRFYSNKKSKEILTTLEQSVEYENEEEASVIVFGKKHKIPRKQAAFGDMGTSYKFSGKDVTAKSWSECAILLDIKHKIERQLNDKYNFVLLNRYKDGNDKMGFHRDNERDIKKHTNIAAISFGQERDIIFKHQDIVSNRNKNNNKMKNTNLGVKIVKIKLNNGSLLVMREPTNDKWYHEIPKRAKLKQVRVSLTYRTMIPRLTPNKNEK